VEAGAKNAGLDVHPLQLLPHQRRRSAAALGRLIAELRPDLVNSQSARDRQALTWLGLTRRLAVPTVFTRRQMPLTFWLENWLQGRVADRVVAVSQAVAEALVRRGTPRAKVRVIHNGLVTERVDRPVSQQALQQWKERIGWQPGRLTAGIVARRKDQRVVLQALSRVEPPIRLVLAGVEQTGELAELAGQVPARHGIVFVPFDSDVRPLYDLLDIVLLPSRMEGLSQALLEAMALGKPVAVSGATGNLEVVTHEVDGLLVEPLNPGAWATAIHRLATDPAASKVLGEKARVTARQRFSIDHTVARTEQLYAELLGRS
jgi:glycosyltransferase involved in cell wall biosynthesis